MKVGIIFLMLMGLHSTGWAQGAEAGSGGTALILDNEIKLAEPFVKKTETPDVGEAMTLSPELKTYLRQIRGVLEAYEVSSDEFWENKVFGPDVKFFLSEELPCNDRVELLPGTKGDPVLFACTDWNKTWFKPSIFSKLNLKQQAIAVIHERLHAFSPAPHYILMGFTTTLLEMLTIQNEQFKGNRDSLSEGETAFIKALFELAPKLGFLFKGEALEIYSNGGGVYLNNKLFHRDPKDLSIHNLSPEIDPQAFIGIGSRIEGGCIQKEFDDPNDPYQLNFNNSGEIHFPRNVSDRNFMMEVGEVCKIQKSVILNSVIQETHVPNGSIIMNSKLFNVNLGQDNRIENSTLEAHLTSHLNYSSHDGLPYVAQTIHSILTQDSVVIRNSDLSIDVADTKTEDSRFGWVDVQIGNHTEILDSTIHITSPTHVLRMGARSIFKGLKSTMKGRDLGGHFYNLLGSNDSALTLLSGEYDFTLEPPIQILINGEQTARSVKDVMNLEETEVRKHIAEQTLGFDIKPGPFFYTKLALEGLKADTVNFVLTSKEVAYEGVVWVPIHLSADAFHSIYEATKYKKSTLLSDLRDIPRSFIKMFTKPAEHLVDMGQSIGESASKNQGDLEKYPWTGLTKKSGDIFGYVISFAVYHSKTVVESLYYFIKGVLWTSAEFVVRTGKLSWDIAQLPLKPIASVIAPVTIPLIPGLFMASMGIVIESAVAGYGIVLGTVESAFVTVALPVDFVKVLLWDWWHTPQLFMVLTPDQKVLASDLAQKIETVFMGAKDHQSLFQGFESILNSTEEKDHILALSLIVQNLKLAFTALSTAERSHAGADALAEIDQEMNELSVLHATYHADLLYHVEHAK